MEKCKKFERWQQYNELKNKVVKYITDNYTEDYVNQQIDESMYEYIDSDWDNDDEYESEYDWYLDYGRGEAESDVRMEIERDVLKKFQLDYEKYLEITGQELWDTIYEIFPQLNVD